MSDRTQPPARMRYSFESRCRAVQAVLQGTPVALVAQRFGAARATVYRWWVRYRAEGWDGLRDRPSTPHHQPRRTPPEVEARILAARERGGDGPVALASKLGLVASTVGKVLRRWGRSRRPRAAAAGGGPLRTGAAG